jgi:hypothetical protein
LSKQYPSKLVFNENKLLSINHLQNFVAPVDENASTSMQLKQKLSSATAAIKSVFGQSEDGQDSAVHPFMYLCDGNQYIF